MGVRFYHSLTQEQFNLEISGSFMIVNHIKAKKTISEKFVGKSQLRIFSRPKACQNRNPRGAYDGPINLVHVPRNYAAFKHQFLFTKEYIAIAGHGIQEV